MNSVELKLLSFPWIVLDVLMQIYQKNEHCEAGIKKCYLIRLVLIFYSIYLIKKTLILLNILFAKKFHLTQFLQNIVKNT